MAALTAFFNKHGIDIRAWLALTRAMILMDLRSQHYAQATATRPHYRFSPLFWVVGQCQFVSAITSLLLFARVDVFFFVLANLTLSMLVIASAVLVEFHEVVLDPRDLDIIGHRPVGPRTYAAARLANLLFYVGLMFLALNLVPMILGLGLRDAGPWYVPAYLVAALAGNLTVVAVVILGLAAAPPGRLEHWKSLFAWTQIVLVFIGFYGGQLMLRDGGQGLLLWGAFPPAWVEYLPPAWLARFVEAAAVEPGPATLLAGVGLAAVACLACVVTALWLGRHYHAMHPAAVTMRGRPMPAGRVGSLAGPLERCCTRTREERVGFWMARTLLSREPALVLRCLWPLNLAVAAAFLGICTGQFANPAVERDPRQVTLSILSLYLLALAVPPMLHQLMYHRDAAASWVVAAAPVERAAGLARGTCRAVLFLIVAPLCLVWGVVAAVVWADPLAAALSAALGWLVAALLGHASLRLLITHPFFSLPVTRGAATGLLAVPMAILSTAVGFLASVHYWLAPSPWFWLAAGVVLPLLWLGLGWREARR